MAAKIWNKGNDTGQRRKRKEKNKNIYTGMESKFEKVKKFFGMIQTNKRP